MEGRIRYCISLYLPLMDGMKTETILRGSGLELVTALPTNNLFQLTAARQHRRKFISETHFSRVSSSCNGSEQHGQLEKGIYLIASSEDMPTQWYHFRVIYEMMHIIDTYSSLL